VKLTESATVRGGSGDDVLLGPDDRDGGATMYGGLGDDTLRGGRGDDWLTGGPGNDVVYGQGGEDELRDGESDAQAAVDRFDGGRQDHRHWDSPTGDTLSYESRRSDLVVDLATGTWSAEDTVAGVESVIGGRGNDQLFGDAHNNRLWAGSGSDLVSGRSGQDDLSGGDGDDRLFGDDGNDDVEGGRGTDALAGGTGDDFLESAAESFSVGDREHEDPGADVLACDAGADLARSDRLDTLTAECERVSTDVVGLHSVPSIDPDSADFILTCRTAFPQPAEVPPALAACTGSISLSGPDGQDYGRQAFKIPVEDYGESAEAIVAVPLNAVARTALVAGTLVQVVVASKDTSSPAGGYRIFLHASPVSSR
jgi:Ca2+-binding RTX toxin-like protein